MSDIFPIYLNCYGDQFPHYFYELQKAFMDNRPENESWWTFDAIVLSQTEIEFQIWSLYGYGSIYGRGGEPYKTDVAFGATVSAETTWPIIHRELQLRAVQRRNQELREAEERLIAQYIEEDRIALGLQH